MENPEPRIAPQVLACGGSQEEEDEDQKDRQRDEGREPYSERRGALADPVHLLYRAGLRQFMLAGLSGHNPVWDHAPHPVRDELDRCAFATPLDEVIGNDNDSQN